MRTRLARSALLLAALGTLVGLSACSDDSDPEPSAASSSAAPTDGGSSAASEPAQAPTPFGDNCDVIGTVSGDETLELEGVGDSDTDIAEQGPAAFYQLVVPPDTSLTVYAAGKGFKPSAILGVGTDTYGPLKGGGAGIVAADDGTSATLDLELGTAGGAQTVQVQATFTCTAP